jgi:hypothetical protein
MGKYEPLGQFLKKQKRARVPMTFSQIEKIIGTKLPKSKSSRAFWSNNPDNNVMTREWIAAGFETQSIDTKDGAVVFAKKKAAPTQRKKHGEKPFKSIFGCLKGTVTFAPGFDPAEPFFNETEWDEIEREWLANWDEMMRRDFSN